MNASDVLQPNTPQQSMPELFRGLLMARGRRKIASCIALLERARLRRIGSHAEYEALRLENTLTDFQFHRYNSDEVYGYLITELRTGRLRDLVDALEVYQRSCGMAVPHPTERLVDDMLRYLGTPRVFSGLTKDELRELFYRYEWLDDGVPVFRYRPFIFFTTGVGRTRIQNAELSSVWRGGGRIEGGGSVGANARDIKKIYGFKRATSLDWMSERSAAAIPAVFDFSQKVKIPFSPQKLAEMAGDVSFCWDVDVRRHSLASLPELRAIQELPVVVGIHNVLLYWEDTTTILENVLENPWEHFFLWISSEGTPYHAVCEIQGDACVRAWHE